MKIATIGVEDWLNVYEKSATVDIAQSTIASLTMDEILRLDGTDGAGFYEQLGREKMNYGWIEARPTSKRRWRSFTKTSSLRTSCRRMALPARTFSPL